MKIVVDADACPRAVLEICLRAGRKHHIPVWTVASFDHDIQSDHHLVVGTDPQEADMKILNLAGTGDVVITQDGGLAAMVLGKEAKCLNPSGGEFHPEKIDFLLEEREMKAKFRRAGGRTKGPKKRTSQDDRRFERTLEQILRQETHKHSILH